MTSKHRLMFNAAKVRHPDWSVLGRARESGSVDELEAVHFYGEY